MRGRLVRIRIAPLSADAHARTAPADSTPIDAMRSAWPRSALHSGTRIAELLRRRGGRRSSRAHGTV